MHHSPAFPLCSQTSAARALPRAAGSEVAACPLSIWTRGGARRSGSNPVGRAAPASIDGVLSRRMNVPVPYTREHPLICTPLAHPQGGRARVGLACRRRSEHGGCVQWSARKPAGRAAPAPRSKTSMWPRAMPLCRFASSAVNPSECPTARAGQHACRLRALGPDAGVRAKVGQQASRARSARLRRQGIAQPYTSVHSMHECAPASTLLVYAELPRFWVGRHLSALDLDAGVRAKVGQQASRARSARLPERGSTTAYDTALTAHAQKPSATAQARAATVAARAGWPLPAPPARPRAPAAPSRRGKPASADASQRPAH